MINKNLIDKEFVKTPEAATLLDPSLGTVKAMADNDEIDGWKALGGHRRVSAASLLNFKGWEISRQETLSFGAFNVCGRGSALGLIPSMLVCLCLFGQAVSAYASDVAELKNLVATAIDQHPSLRARQFDVGAAASETESARWQYGPTPSFSVSRPDKALVAGTDRRVEQIGLKQPLWTGGRLEAQLALAQARQQVAQASWRELRRDIALEVVQAWGEAYTAQARMQAWEKSLAVHQRLLDQIFRRTEQGLSAQSDLELAVGRKQALVADQLSARASLDAALERLQTLTGQKVALLFVLPKPIFNQAPAVEAATEQALSLDPTLERLQHEGQELQAQLANASSTLLPELSLSVTQRRGDVTGTNNQVSVAFESKWGGGVPNTAAIRGASLRMNAKQEDITYRKRKVTEQIRADLRLLESTRIRIQAYQQALRAAEAVAQSWDRQYFAGKKSWQEVMNAARENAQADVQLIDATSSAIVTEWRLALSSRGVESVVQTAAVNP